jgi:hypothetical protein
MRPRQVSKSENDHPPKREYPGFYERLVPIALGLIAVAILVILLVILGVALGFFSAG